MNHFSSYALDKQSNLSRYLLHRRYVQTDFSHLNLLINISHNLHIPPLPLGLCSPTADCSLHPSRDTSQGPASSSDFESSPRKTLRPTTRPRFLRQISSEQQAERWVGKSRICPISQRTCRSMWCSHGICAIGKGREHGTKNHNVSARMGCETSRGSNARSRRRDQ